MNRRERASGGDLIAPVDYDVESAQAEEGCREEQCGGDDCAFLTTGFEGFHTRKKAEGQVEEGRANSAEAKGLEELPVGGVCHGCQKCEDAENQQHAVAAENQPGIVI